MPSGLSEEDRKKIMEIWASQIRTETNIEAMKQWQKDAPCKEHATAVVEVKTRLKTITGIVSALGLMVSGVIAWGMKKVFYGG